MKNDAHLNAFVPARSAVASIQLTNVNVDTVGTERSVVLPRLVVLARFTAWPDGNDAPIATPRQQTASTVGFAVERRGGSQGEGRIAGAQAPLRSVGRVGVPGGEGPDEEERKENDEREHRAGDAMVHNSV